MLAAKKKKKSMRALTDSLSRIRALWVLLSSAYLTVAHWLVFVSQQVYLWYCFFKVFLESVLSFDSVRYLTTRNWESLTVGFTLHFSFPNCCFILLWHFSPAIEKLLEHSIGYCWLSKSSLWPFAFNWNTYMLSTTCIKRGLFAYLRLNPIALYIQ